MRTATGSGSVDVCTFKSGRVAAERISICIYVVTVFNATRVLELDACMVLELELDALGLRSHVPVIVFVICNLAVSR